MTRDDFLVFGRPSIGEAEITEVVDSLRSGWIGTGPKVRQFELMLADYLHAKHVRCVSSCTAALFLALKSLDIGPGDEVLIPAMTFVATANAIEHTGARPVLVDVEPISGLMNLDAAGSAVNERTRAIMPVHLYGRPLDMDRLNAWRDRYNIPVVEDAAHAIGARWRERPIGAFGNLTAFSFYPTKNITTIEGGALVTDDGVVATAIEQLALHGLSVGAWQRFSDAGFRHYYATRLGYKYNMTDIQAALGIHQLPRLDDWTKRRDYLAAYYREQLAALPVEAPLPATSEMTHAWHLFPVLVGKRAKRSRDEVLDSLTRSNIGTGVHYTGVHLHPYYRDRYNINPASLPIATDMSRRTLSLPLGPAISDRDAEDVVEALTRALAVPAKSPAANVPQSHDA
jgi:dTDP-4-amino-4,6-dideoxygalactose transaminase